ncbi:hypothetical protein A0130_11845 [Leifsonia xyli]|uniref:DUF3800 domain-containing protein n=1 Tax=Leifsonia xyli TaxID=1575 RepID=UPI0007CDC189|nr:hypothetical protein A0130_11845 [Leifsonia xyli]
MHLCYVDDSGDSRRGVLLTALIIEDVQWTRCLQAWLEGRRAIHRAFGVPKARELHASELYKGRGRYCETDHQNAAFGTAPRAAVGRIMMSHLSKRSSFTVITVGTSDRSPANAYARLIAFLEDWAEASATQLLIFYDGQDGMTLADNATVEESEEIWQRAIRAAAPYRHVHRSLDLSNRRIIEDVIMQDSRHSQLIQAADLLAYGAYHKHAQIHPEIWGPECSSSPAAIRAYMQAAGHWPDDSDFGVYWLG